MSIQPLTSPPPKRASPRKTAIAAAMPPKTRTKRLLLRRMTFRAAFAMAVMVLRSMVVFTSNFIYLPPSTKNALNSKITAQGDENTAVPPGFPIGALMTSVTGGPAAPYACSGTRLRDDLPRLRGTPCTRRRLSGTPWEACTPSLLCLLHGL